MDEDFKSRLQKYVNSEKFWKSLMSNLDGMTENMQFKAQLELLSFIVPKVKSEDGDSLKAPPTIQINYVEDTTGEE